MNTIDPVYKMSTEDKDPIAATAKLRLSPDVHHLFNIVVYDPIYKGGE